jgi:hypothetical protein
LVCPTGSFLVRRGEGPLGPPGCCVTGLGCPWSRVLTRDRAGPGAVGGITFTGLLPPPLDVGAWPALGLRGTCCSPVGILGLLCEGDSSAISGAYSSGFRCACSRCACSSVSRFLASCSALLLASRSRRALITSVGVRTLCGSADPANAPRPARAEPFWDPPVACVPLGKSDIRAFSSIMSAVNGL